MTNSYDDIIHLPRHSSATHPQMPIADRAAQFSPFAALTGYDAAVKEAARLADKRLELDDGVKEALNARLRMIADWRKDCPEISITYFQPDAKKAGGAYVTAVGTVKKIDEYERIVLMADGAVIPINEIFIIDGQLFEALEFYLIEGELK